MRSVRIDGQAGKGTLVIAKGSEIQEMASIEGPLSAPLKLLGSSKTLKYPAGEAIVAQGDRCSEIHYMQDGIVKLTMLSSRGRAAVVGILCQGDFFGEECIIGALSFVNVEARNRSLRVQAFHTFPDDYAIVKSQSVFETP